MGTGAGVSGHRKTVRILFLLGSGRAVEYLNMKTQNLRYSNMPKCSDFKILFPCVCFMSTWGYVNLSVVPVETRDLGSLGLELQVVVSSPELRAEDRSLSSLSAACVLNC